MAVIFCVLVEKATAFPVRFDETQTVDELKEEIKAAVDPKLRSLAANKLTLYRVDIDASNRQEYIEAVKKIAQELHKHTKLHPMFKLSSVFEDLDPPVPPRRTVHILVKFPEG